MKTSSVVIALLAASPALAHHEAASHTASPLGLVLGLVTIGVAGLLVLRSRSRAA